MQTDKENTEDTENMKMPHSCIKNRILYTEIIKGGVPFEFKGIVTMLHGVPQNQSLRWEICLNETEGKLSGERRKAGQGRAQNLPKTLVSVGYFSLVPLWKNLEYTLHHQTNPTLKRGSSFFTPSQLV